MNISTKNAMSLIVSVTLSWAGAACCNSGDADASSEPTAASANTAPPQPDKASTPVAATGEVSVNKVQKPLEEWQSDDVKAALEGSGWKITGSTQTKSSMVSIIVSATKGDTKAKVNYYKNGGPFWKKGLVKEKAAIHEQGDVIVGVIVEGNEQAAQKLLDSLLGR